MRALSSRKKYVGSVSHMYRKASQYFSSSFCTYRFHTIITAAVRYTYLGMVYCTTSAPYFQWTILPYSQKETYTKLQKTNRQQRFLSDNDDKLQHIVYNSSCERAAYKNPAQLRQSRDCAGILCCFILSQKPFCP